MNIASIRKVLIEDFMVAKQDLVGVQKPELEAMLAELKEDDEEIDIKENVALPDTTEDNQAEITPPWDSEEWHDYIMKQFRKKELANNEFPRYYGLKRITEELIGPILKTEVMESTPPNEGNSFIATVTMGLTVGPVILPDHPCVGQIIYREDMADIKMKDDAYSKRPSSSAVTVAESRCLRKILGLQTIAAEETGEDIEQGLSTRNALSGQQKVVIETLVTRNNIDIDLIIKPMEKEKIDDLTEAEALEVIEELNRIQRGK